MTCSMGLHKYPANELGLLSRAFLGVSDLASSGSMIAVFVSAFSESSCFRIRPGFRASGATMLSPAAIARLGESSRPA